ncbi:MAG: 4-alpha-glucanotransferase [Chthoniobacterales bacterium]
MPASDSPLKLHPDKKLAGILAPLFAIRGEADLGIGDTRTLRELGLWAKENGFGVLQILPFNETSGDNSPYNIISAFAIEPSTISTSPEDLLDLKAEDFNRACKLHNVEKLKTGDVNYAGVKALKWSLLHSAFKNFARNDLAKKTKHARAFASFLKENKDWIAPYALFRTFMEIHHHSEVTDTWPEPQRTYRTAVKWLEKQSATTRKKIRHISEFYSYVQWVAHRQWEDTHHFLTSIGVALIGDVPVGVSLYSADVFAEPEIFDLTRSAGAPPEKVFKTDPFTEKWGQNWGFPLYKWEAMARDDYAWWRRRLRAMRKHFHFLRLDHALGFFRIYSFPWRPQQNAEFLPLSATEAKAKAGNRLPCFMMRDDSSPENQELNREQGETLFSMILEETEKFHLIAEDLGALSLYVRPVLEKLEIPGFKIPQWERSPDNRITPGQNYPRISITTYATHDHEPVRKFWDEWFTDSQQGGDRYKAATYHMRELLDFTEHPEITVPQEFTEEIHLAMVTGLFKTNAWLAVHMVTDLFGLSDQFNAPGKVSSDNWTHRLEEPVSGWSARWSSILPKIKDSLKETDRLPIVNK